MEAPHGVGHEEVRASRTLQVATGLSVAAAGFMIARHVTTSARRGWVDRRQGSLRAYLLDHLSGSDAAIRVVSQLCRELSHEPEGALFDRLFDEFAEERALVVTLLEMLGASPRSMKRAAASAGGTLLRAVSAGDPGELSLFRTVEALAIGIQGKRLLWRALQAIAPIHGIVTRQQLNALEMQAVEQWEQLDEYRCSLAPLTFKA